MIRVLRPDPPLYPRDPAGRAEVQVFVEWFNEVWKRPPNALADGATDPGLSSRLRGWVPLFDSCSTGATICSATSAPPT